ncbi:hypothetical protein M885DRAFT_551281 [Pelagophyceae sp. CCMP2097]|nr:hypothetical protein M885DRAFT_551281 [Pelagophyceae sp. CCMP2097]
MLDRLALRLCSCFARRSPERASLLGRPCEALRGGSAAATASAAHSTAAWLSDDDDLAATCFGCAVEFSNFERRHHCRRCGNTFCGACSKHTAILLAHGSSAEERVCEACFCAAPADNDFYGRILPVLTRGGTFGMRAASFLGAFGGGAEHVIVKLNAAKDALVVLDSKSTAPAPKRAITLSDVLGVNEPSPTSTRLVICCDAGDLTLEAPAARERATFAAALRAAALRACVPGTGAQVEQDRRRLKADRAKADEVANQQARRQANEAQRNALSDKYGLKREAIDR